jgi:transglutaminase-like putative cysteine protease
VLGQAVPRTSAALVRDPYFRLAAYEVLDAAGRTWSSDPRAKPETEYLSSSGEVTLATPSVAPTVEVEMVFVAAAAQDLPVPDGTVSLAFGDPRPGLVRRDATGRLQASPAGPVARWIYAARALPSAGHEEGDRRHDAAARRTLALPPALREALAPLVSEALGDAAAPSDRAHALSAWIRGRCAYSLSVAPPADSASPIEDFLRRTRSGHCEYFAAALAACLRVAGVPSRVVSGFHASRWNDAHGGFWVLRRRDAHAWVEAWIEEDATPGFGSWVRLDATPAAIRDPDPYAGFLGFLARWRDAISLEWARRVIGFDRDAQRRSVAGLTEGLGSLLGEARRSVPTAAVLLLATGLGWAALASRSRRTRRVRSRVEFYERLLCALARRGLVRRPSETAAQFARRAENDLPDAAVEAVEEATIAFEAVRYGEGEPPPAERPREWLARVSVP